MTLQEKARLAADVAREAGNMIRENRKFRVDMKAQHDFVTEMDVKSEQLIRERLLAACPEDEFFGEESGGSTDAKGRWIVDPIDGTGNYVKDIPLYTISIAYELDGVLEIGCVYAPALDEMYLAVRGEGATMNGQPIHVSDVDSKDLAIFAMSFGARIPESHQRTLDTIDNFLHSCNDLRRFGSAAFDLCSVACGRIEGYFEFGLYIYDIAAGVVILKEAGGTVTGWSDDEDVLKTCNVCASNTHMHEYMKANLVL